MPASQEQSTFATLARLYVYAKPAMPRLYLAVGVSLVASLVSLAKIGRAHV